MNIESRLRRAEKLVAQSTNDVSSLRQRMEMRRTILAKKELPDLFQKIDRSLPSGLGLELTEEELTFTATDTDAQQAADEEAYAAIPPVFGEKDQEIVDGFTESTTRALDVVEARGADGAERHLGLQPLTLWIWVKHRLNQSLVQRSHHSSDGRVA